MNEHMGLLWPREEMPMLPDALEAWLDGHCEPGMDDDPNEADRDRRVIAQAFEALLGPESEVDALGPFADRLHEITQVG